MDGYSLKVLGKVTFPFSTDSNTLSLKAHVIQDLTSDVILGRNFSQKLCAKIDFDEGMIESKQGR